jgi:hypothetical protein
VEIGDDIIDNFKFIAGGNENAGFSGERMQNTVIIAGGF